MPKIELITANCIGCGLCTKSCPFGAITLIPKPEHPRKQLVVIDIPKCNFCGACVEACKKYNAIIITKEIPEIKEYKTEDYRGVWIYAEQRHNEISPVVYELLYEGKKLANKLQVPLSAVLIGNNISDKAQEIIWFGADKVYIFDNPIFKEFQDEPYSVALAQLIKEEKPEIVLMGATNIGRSFASRVAAKINTGLTADCTNLDVDIETRNLLQTRPAFGGNIMATILTPRHRPQMATIRHKVFKRAQKDTTRTGEVIKKNIDVTKLSLWTNFIDFVADTTANVNLSEADIIVSGGRGLGKPEGFKLIEELANLLNGAVGASRAAVDAGWIPYSHQVGQTGRTVTPKLYIACGISGQIQHLIGMGSSQIIIAINKDPEAPMMKIATFALLGNLYEIIPEMIKEIKSLRNG